MIGPIIEILFGLAVWKLLPGMIVVKKKQRTAVALICNVVGALLILAGGVHLVTSFF